ncbi:unnamed protein product [Heterobilharzia americana]|nr:unnamed protein product [Heterobilharzia americana]
MKVKGCCSIANKAKRFPALKSDGPPPDAYNVVSPWGGKKPDPCGLLFPQKVLNQLTGEPDYNTRSVSCDRIPYVRFRDVPSIPSGQFVHGYEEGPDGRLQPQSGPKRDETLGPAFYGPTKDPVFTRYKGCGWSRSTSERDLLRRTSYSVGPGEYNPYSDHWQKLIDSPRFMDKVVYELHKHNFPSPCSYNILEKQISKANGLQAPFNTEEQRFKEKLTDTPAPNKYDPKDGAISRRWLRRFRPKPFDTTAERFFNKTCVGPAPNSYIINDGIKEFHTRYFSDTQINKGVGFGSTAKRMNYNLFSNRKASERDGDIPGPGQYNPQRYDDKCTLKAIGIPKAKREISIVKSSAPPPGTYEFGKSFDVTQCKRAPAVPRTVEGRQRRTCFSNTAERFGKFSALGPKDLDIPGPGEYCIVQSRSQKGRFISQSERFKEIEREQFPGPADYELSATVADSVLKSTFNVTLDSPCSFNKWSDEPVLVKI